MLQLLTSLFALTGATTDGAPDGACTIEFAIRNHEPRRVSLSCEAESDIELLETVARSQMEVEFPTVREARRRMTLQLYFDRVTQNGDPTWVARPSPIIRIQPTYPRGPARDGHAAICSINYSVVDRAVEACFACAATGSLAEFEAIVAPTLASWVYTDSPRVDGLSTQFEWSRPGGDPLPAAPEAPQCEPD